MTEVLFILTTIFVAYVVYVVVGDQVSDLKSMASKSDAKPKQAAPASAVAREAHETLEKPVPQATPGAKETPSARAPASTGTAAVKGGLKDPATGEVVNIPNNYRFARRWIKEALVSEGLLDKVYKNNELDEKTNAKIKRALTKLAKMDQYKG